MNIADAILGRRFQFAGGTAPDITIIAVDPDKGEVSVHRRDGVRDRLPLWAVLEGIDNGALQESPLAPFQLPEQGWMVRRQGRTVMATAAETFGR